MRVAEEDWRVLLVTIWVMCCTILGLVLTAPLWLPLVVLYLGGLAALVAASRFLTWWTGGSTDEW